MRVRLGEMECTLCGLPKVRRCNSRKLVSTQAGKPRVTRCALLENRIQLSQNDAVNIRTLLYWCFVHKERLGCGMCVWAPRVFPSGSGWTSTNQSIVTKSRVYIPVKRSDSLTAYSL